MTTPSKDPADVFKDGLRLVTEGIKTAVREATSEFRDDVWSEVTREGARRLADAVASAPRNGRTASDADRGVRRTPKDAANAREALLLGLASRAVEALEQLASNVSEMNERGRPIKVDIRAVQHPDLES